MPVNLTNTVDIVADSIHIKKDNKLVNLIDNITNITGLPPETMNSLEKIASAMDNDPDFFQTVANGLEAKLDTSTFTQAMTNINAEFDTVHMELDTLTAALNTKAAAFTVTAP